MKFLNICLLLFTLTQSSMSATLEDKQLHTTLRIITNFILLLNETTAPTFLNDSNISIAENNASALTVELNTTESVTYAISDGDSDLFDINSTTGVITFNNAPDYESGNILYTFTVTATTSKGEVFTQEVTIHISDIVETQEPKKTGQILSYDASGSPISTTIARDDGHYAETVGVEHHYERNATTETVIDHVTNLEWADDANVSSVTKQWVTTANYNDGNYSDTSGDTATTYCANLRLGGYEDWRLPTIDELVYITDKSKLNPSIDESFFQNTASSYYWSSTTYAYYTDYAWVVNFNSGYDGNDDKDNSYYVRCVRARQ